MISQVTIIAPGLLGASLGMACRVRALAERIVVWARRPEARAACAREPWCDAAPDTIGEAVREAELVVFCAPVAHIPALLEAAAAHLAEGALLTDVGSTKAEICEAAPGRLPAGRHFIGAHPMAGSEKSGMDHARADLFEGRPCFLTPLPETPAEARSRIEAFWSGLGMRLHHATPAGHDALVAHVSHLPHLVASALSLAVGRATPEAGQFAGAGLRDTTRVAAGSPEMWRAICEQNREAILRAVADFQESLDAFSAAIEGQDYARLEHLFAEGRDHRRSLDACDDA